jgi:hypothetical protein
MEVPKAHAIPAWGIAPGLGQPGVEGLKVRSKISYGTGLRPWICGFMPVKPGLEHNTNISCLPMMFKIRVRSGARLRTSKPDLWSKRLPGRHQNLYFSLIPKLVDKLGQIRLSFFIPQKIGESLFNFFER